MERYRGRRVLLTGHTGFKGAWLARWLDALGAEVHGIALPPEPGGAYDALDVASCSIGHEVDIRDDRAVRAVVEGVAPSVVFHLAAQALVRRGWRAPVETFDTNVTGSVHVVDAAVRCGSVDAIVAVTSDKVYANDGSGRAFVEDDPLGGHDPYSASKAAAELALVPYRSPALLGISSAARLVTVRAGNVIGGADRCEDRLVPDLVRGLEHSEVVLVRRPEAVRPWQHVLDCLRGYLLAGDRLLAGLPCSPAYNFAHDGATASVQDVVDLVGPAWGASEGWYRIHRDDSASEATTLRLDAGLARRELGWRPAWDLSEAVARTIALYRCDDPAALALAQITANTLGGASPTSVASR